MNKDLECPYCEEWNEVCHDDGQGFDEDRAHEMQCSHCDKNFVFHTAISYDYRPTKADCLNGAPHRFRPWRYLYDHQVIRVEDRGCQDCDHRERREIPLPVENSVIQTPPTPSPELPASPEPAPASESIPG